MWSRCFDYILLTTRHFVNHLIFSERKNKLFVCWTNPTRSIQKRGIDDCSGFIHKEKTKEPCHFSNQAIKYNTISDSLNKMGSIKTRVLPNISEDISSEVHTMRGAAFVTQFTRKLGRGSSTANTPKSFYFMRTRKPQLEITWNNKERGKKNSVYLRWNTAFPFNWGKSH